MFFTVAVALIQALQALAESKAPATYSIPNALQNVLQNTHGAKDLYTYPTDFTRGIIPVKIHSHNDYWRDLPFYSALSVGAISVEADVWLYKDTLYVGHERSALTQARTFEALYIEPILDTLNRTNPKTQFVTEDTKNGVFDTDATQTLYFWIDMKTDGDTTFPYVSKALEPLRQKGYLTTVTSKDSAPVPGQVTVIGTGNTPQSAVTKEDKKDIFFDANLAKLGSQPDVTSQITPIASVDFEAAIGTVNGSLPELLNSTQLATLRDQISTASKRGIGARYWNTPAWPISVRNQLWKLLYMEGVALVNVDDVAAGAGLLQRW